MARYRGPRLKKCRYVGVVLPGITADATLERPFPPGDHGARRRSKPSDYKVRLLEKQKARFHFGILEKQFKRYVVEAMRQKGPSGQNLVRLLQSRLDNVVYRMGLARTITAARQLVVHGHVMVDQKRVDRPSFHVRPGMEVQIRERSRNKPFMQQLLEESASSVRPSWIEFDPAKAMGKIIGLPERSELPFELNEQSIIEHYSQQL
jgi:small subunit ribosomal protein S4